MKQFGYIIFSLVSLIIVSLTFHVHSTAAQQDQQIAIPSITPYWIKRQAYDTATALVLSKGKGGSQNPSFLSSVNLGTAIPSTAGALSIILGSMFTWIKLKSKHKLYEKYMQQITNAEMTFNQSRRGDPNTKKKAAKALEEVLLKSQEQIDLSAADKKIDAEQRTSLAHIIERKLAEVKNA